MIFKHPTKVNYKFKLLINIIYINQILLNLENKFKD
jgi:hypothetical protein